VVLAVRGLQIHTIETPRLKRRNEIVGGAIVERL
jgi:hypothetical protein